MKKKSHSTGKIVNRRARYDYDLSDQFEVGIELTGVEAKSLRLGHGRLAGSYVTVKNDELYLINTLIMPSTGLPINEQNQTRTRKLLAKRKEIDHIIDEKRQGRSIIPLELLTRGRYIKLKIALGKGKKRYDKRETIKRRQQERDIARQAK